MKGSKGKLNIITGLFCLVQSVSSFGQNNLQAKYEQIVGNINGNVGISALVIETGESMSFNEGKRFPMQSVYKFPIAMAMLYRVDKGSFSLYDTINIDRAGHKSRCG